MIPEHQTILDYIADHLSDLGRVEWSKAAWYKSSENLPIYYITIDGDWEFDISLENAKLAFNFYHTYTSIIEFECPIEDPSLFEKLDKALETIKKSYQP